ncbi:MAG TPA: group III truncated hemoglobin [Chitinophagaceae bacterium]|jgi:hemoglobin|nr:group III truncated hemoglobin [Chitinophagaceae bacterium]
MKKDIENRDDIALLVSRFYDKLLADDSISYLFTDVAKIDLPHHLSIITDFWEMVLMQTDSYRKNAMQPHLALHQQSPLEEKHFTTWLRYFRETVDELFEGEKAFLAKERALSIATMMRIKIAQLQNKAPR